MLWQLFSEHGKNVGSSRASGGGVGLHGRGLACTSIAFGTQLLQLAELHGVRHGALHLQLALHEQLLRVGSTGHHAHKVALAHGDGAVTLLHFALANTAGAVLQINHPLLGVVASDVPLVHSLHLADDIGVLRQLFSEHGKNCFCGYTARGGSLCHGGAAGLVLLVEGDYASAAETKIVLKTNCSTLNLPCSSFAAQLPA